MRMRTLAVAAVLAAVGSGTARAHDYQPRAIATPEEGPRWIDMAVGKVYLAGDFRGVSRGGPPGVELDPVTGSAVETTPDGPGTPGHAAIPDGTGGWFVGVSGDTAIRHVAADGTFDSGFSPPVRGIVRALALANDRLYAAGELSGARAVVALDPRTGAVDRRFEPPLSGLTGTTLALGAGRVYVATHRGYPNRPSEVHALDPLTGARDPAFAFETAAAITELAVGGARVFVGGVEGDFFDGGGVLFALDAATGTPDPAFHFGPPGRVGALLPIGGALYAGGRYPRTRRGWLTLLGSDGTPDGRFAPSPPGPIEALAFGSGRVYAGGSAPDGLVSEQPSLVALHPATGEPDARFHPAGSARYGGRVNGVAAASGGQIFAAIDSGTIGGVRRNGLAALDAVTGLPTAFNPPDLPYTATPAHAGHTLYATTRQDRSEFRLRDLGRIVALDPHTGQQRARFRTVVTTDTEPLLLGEGSRLYVAEGGDYGRAITTVRAYSAITGARVRGFGCTLRGGVLGTMRVAGRRLALGGSFTRVNGRLRRGFAIVSARTCGVQPAPRLRQPGGSLDVRAIDVSLNHFFVLGRFTHVGGRRRENLFAVSPSGRLLKEFAPGPIDPLGAIEVRNRTVYLLQGNALRMLDIDGRTQKVGYLPPYVEYASSLVVAHGRAFVAGVSYADRGLHGVDLTAPLIPRPHPPT